MATLKEESDVIVVGGGSNGLACAMYLQKSGLKEVQWVTRAVAHPQGT